MKKFQENKRTDNDISMNDFIVNRNYDGMMPFPATMNLKAGQTVKVNNPYRNVKDIFKIVSNPTKAVHGIVECHVHQMNK